jgi:predicted esterase
VPQGYTADTPLPLFVAMHGYGGSASFWSTYEARAEARGFILLAIDSRGTTWDVAQGVFGDDVAFVDRALKHTFDCCRIDPAHIALGGFSDGASCALSLGLANGDLFTHLAGFSPPTLLVTSDPVGASLIFISHGASDTVVYLQVTRDAIVPYLRTHGYSVVYRVFQGGHEVPGAVSDTALDWFSGSPLCGPAEVDNCDIVDEPLQSRSQETA